MSAQPVTGGAVEPTPFHAGARGVLRADRVVGAQRTHPQRIREMVFVVSGLLDQATERPLGIRGARVEEEIP